MSVFSRILIANGLPHIPIDDGRYHSEPVGSGISPLLHNLVKLFIL